MILSPRLPVSSVRKHVRAAGALALLALAAWPAHAADRRSKDAAADLRFAREMAEQGLWREAIFRWERVLAGMPPESEEAGRILNNIAVAAEALGQFDRARAAYEKAVAQTRDKQIAANFELFERAHPRPPPEEGS